MASIPSDLSDPYYARHRLNRGTTHPDIQKEYHTIRIGSDTYNRKDALRREKNQTWIQWEAEDPRIQPQPPNALFTLYGADGKPHPFRTGNCEVSSLATMAWFQETLRKWKTPPPEGHTVEIHQSTTDNPHIFVRISLKDQAGKLWAVAVALTQTYPDYETLELSTPASQTK